MDCHVDVSMSGRYEWSTAITLLSGRGAVGGGAVGGEAGGTDHRHLLKEAMGGEEDRTDEEQLAVVVDESLFDIENLEDLDLNEDDCDVMD